MTSAVTHEIEVSVETEYQAEFSDPKNGLFMFAYHIKIENHSEYAVQLLRRHWFIYDSNGEYREVEGEGVVGEQPILEPSTNHAYSSACNLATDIGKMHGVYQFVRLADGKLFTADIPEFKMVSPFRFN